MAPKEGVVIILDASSTMASTLLEEKSRPRVKVEDGADDDAVEDTTTATTTTTTTSSQSLLDASKAAANMIMIDLMTRSKTHEASVVVLKTKETSHHLMKPFKPQKEDDDEEEQPVDDHNDDEEETELLFPNITELPLYGLNRPNIHLLRQVAEIKSTDDSIDNNNNNDDETHIIQGDFCDGLIIAADAIKRKTNKKKYNRRIILITDAKHRVMVDGEQLSVLLDSMVDMECKLQVVGWNFNANNTTTHPNVKQEEGAVIDDTMKVENENVTNDKTTIKTEDNENDQHENEEDDELQIKAQNESLLLQLATKTNGSVTSVSNMTELLDAVLGESQRQKVQSVQFKTEFHVAPGMVLCSTKYTLLMQKTAPKTLAKMAVMIDDDTKLPMKNGLGDEMTNPITTDYKHLDPDDLEVVLEQYDRTPAYRFGNDYIPIGSVDLAGLATLSPSCIRLLGYIDAAAAPRHLLVGPPYLVTGAGSVHDCAALSALAQGLEQLQYVAIGTFVKKQNHDPILAGLLPFTETCKTTSKVIHRLVLFKLPFAGDVQHFTLPSLDEHITEESASGCDELIDALMLGDSDLVCNDIPNPFTALYRKMLGERAANPACAVVSSVRGGPDDRMCAPPHILEKAAHVIQTFYETFPLAVVESAKKVRGKNGKAAANKRKGPLSARDFM